MTLNVYTCLYKVNCFFLEKAIWKLQKVLVVQRTQGFWDWISEPYGQGCKVEKVIWETVLLCIAFLHPTFCPGGPLLRAHQTQQPQGGQQGAPGKPAFPGTQDINREVFGGKKGTEKEAIRLLMPSKQSGNSQGQCSRDERYSRRRLREGFDLS